MIDINNDRILASEKRLQNTIINQLTSKIKNVEEYYDKGIGDIAHSVNQINAQLRDFFDTIMQYIFNSNTVITSTFKENSDTIKLFIGKSFQNQEERNFEKLDNIFNVLRKQLNSMQKSFLKELLENVQELTKHLNNYTVENKECYQDLDGKYDRLVEKIEAVSQNILKFEKNTTSKLNSSEILLNNVTHVLSQLNEFNDSLVVRLDILQKNVIENNKLLECNIEGITVASYCMERIRGVIFNLNFQLIYLFKKAFPDVDFFPRPLSVENRPICLSIESDYSITKEENQIVLKQNIEEKDLQKKEEEFYSILLNNRYNKMLFIRKIENIVNYNDEPQEENSLLAIEE